MSHVPKLMRAFSRLLSYPAESTSQTAELLYVVLLGELPAAAREIAEFAANAERCESWELEEAYTGTFDVNPTCALEVGWHLFGEEYARGMFLVRMRQELRKYDLVETGELPDHISHVLAVLAEMPAEEARHFSRACVLPAVAKMSQALERSDSPYRLVVSSLASTLRHIWGESPTADEDAQSRPAFASDPLRAFPVADVGCECSSKCSSPLELFSLDTDRDEQTPSATKARSREP